MIEAIDTYQNTVFRPPEVTPPNPVPGEDASSGNHVRIDTEGNKENKADRFDNSQKDFVQSYNRQGRITQNSDNDNESNEQIDHKESRAPLGSKEKRLGNKDLTKEERLVVEELKRRDQEVRAHEQAHMASGGGLVRGGARYEYQRGPDGRNYAVGGEVSIAAPSGRTPEETIKNMARVKAAALAPADPSSQDRQVAAQADATAAEARAQMAEQKQSEISVKVDSTAQHQDMTMETAAVSPFDNKEKETEGTVRLNIDKPEENTFTRKGLSHRYSIEAYRQNQQTPSSRTPSTVSGGLLSLRA